MRVTYRFEGKGTPHCTLRLWLNGALVGSLTVGEGAEEVLLGQVVQAIKKAPGFEVRKMMEGSNGS